MKTFFTLSAASAALAAAVFPAAAQDTPPQKVTVRAIAHFDFNKTTIQEEDRAKLLAEVGAMKDVTWQIVTATGHTDSVGSPAYNEALAKRRAAAVRGYLLGQGLPPPLLRTAGMGEKAPVADNTTEEGRAQNRRTEVVFEGVRTAPR
jgi:OOP family OmpA-OmpF porin